MERRAILAAMLMAALLMVYQLLFVNPAPQEKAAAPASPSDQATPAPAAPAAAPGPAAAVAPVPPMPVQEGVKPPERKVRVETPLYRAVVSSQGSAIDRWDLHYRGEKEMVLPGVVGSQGLVVMRPGQPAAPIAFAVEGETVKLGKDSPPAELRLVARDAYGLVITQTMRFAPDTYVVERQIRVENTNTSAQSADLGLSWTAPVEWPKAQQAFGGPRPIHTVLLAKGASWARREYLSNAKSHVGEGQWVGFESAVGTGSQSGVYLTALVPQAGGFKVLEEKREETKGGKAEATVEVGVRAAITGLAPGQTWDGRINTYLGPMEYEKLKALGVNLEKAIYFGGFPVPESWADRLPTLPMEWIAVPILGIMRWFYSFVPNYGVAIILLTIITKVVFFPLTIKSMRSMKAMQALQPQVNALRSKYKSDPQRLQRETMELYRANKVNPLGGCLPMVVQVPIFYALYVALSVSVEMQNAPFICFGRMPSWLPGLGGHDVWVCDLAAYDPTYVLPLLMGASMFIQQKMQPVMGDPRQAKMMLFMPILFTFMFLNLPSGLVLYWTVSNVLQIAQQKYMERGATPEKLPVRAAKKA